jgi:DinB family protein
VNRLPTDWPSLLADHAAAVSQFASAIRRSPAERWTQPLAPGRWSPAEITSHLTESYQVLRTELGGGQGMQLRGGRLQRWIFRHTFLRRILKTGLFPAGARAPRETRPHETVADPDTALAALARQAAAFDQELTAGATVRRVRLTHAYFGPMSAQQSLRLVAVHARHHAGQLAPALNL